MIDTTKAISGVSYNGTNFELAGNITTENINMYKFQQLAEANLSGGTMPTNTEFANAETILQTIYNKVMGGENE